MSLHIKDVKVHVISVEPETLGDNRKLAGKGQKRYLGILRIFSQEGLEGHAIVGSRTTDTTRGITPLVEKIKPFLIGKDALDREWMWHRLRGMAPRWDIDEATAMAVDVALWDLAAKSAELPLYQLLGAYRHKVPAYGSSMFHAEVEEEVQDALACKEQGFMGYKVHHVVPDLREVVNVCTRLRQAVGDEMALMFDAECQFGFQEALYVGRALDELNYRWYEDPVAYHDHDSLAELGRRLDTSVAISDVREFRLSEAPNAIGKRAGRILITEPKKDGITGMKKLAVLCEAHHLDVQYHYGGNSLLNVAVLHSMLSVKNSIFFPLVLPVSDNQFGLVHDLEVDSEGHVHAPQGAGLGVEIDWGLMDRFTEAVL